MPASGRFNLKIYLLRCQVDFSFRIVNDLRREKGGTQMRLWWGPAIALILGGSGCTSVSSSVEDGRQLSGAEIEQGLAYSVPTQLVRVTLSRSMETESNVDVLAAEYYEAARTAKSSETELAKLEGALDQLNRLSLLANAKDSNVTPEQRGKIEEARNSAKVVLDDFKPLVKLHQDKRDGALDILKAATDPDPKKAEWKRKRPVDKMTIAALPYSADPRFEFVATFPHNILRTEEHGITANEKGLLQSIDLKTEDATQDLLTGVASVIGFAQSGLSVPQVGANLYESDFKNTLGLSEKWKAILEDLDRESVDDLLKQILAILASFEVPKPPPGPDCQKSADTAFFDETSQQKNGAFSHSLTFDPLDANSVEKFNKQACFLKSNLRLRVSSPSTDSVARNGGFSFPASDAIAADLKGYNSEPTDGIVYRQLRPVLHNISEIRWAEDRSVYEVIIDSQLVDMPNGTPLRRITDFGSTFSKRTSTLKFNNGLLIDYKFKRPSEVGEAANAVVEVVKAPFEIVSEVVQIKVDTAGGQQKIAESTLAIEKLRLEQELALIEKADATETKLTDNALKRSENEQKLSDLVLKSDIAALTRDDATSTAELEAAIAVLKKRKEFLLLQKEIEGLESDD